MPLDPRSPLQPLLHDAAVVLRAPSQAWSRPDGSMGSASIDGIYFSDLRVVDAFDVRVGGEPGEHIRTLADDAGHARFVSLHRALDSGRVADPDVRGTLERIAEPDGTRHRFTLASRLDDPVTTEVAFDLRAVIQSMDLVKAGMGAEAAAVVVSESGGDVSWQADGVSVRLTAPYAVITVDGDHLTLTWSVEVPARGSVTVESVLLAEDAEAVVRAATGDAPWRAAAAALPVPDDIRLQLWLDTALSDLDSLRLTTTDGTDEFLAAGAPWFFTLFGRDSIWAARLMLPLGTELAGSTLRVLAALQGTREVDATAEQPGKIMHELRRGTLHIPGENVSIPPLYYGTVDATPLWVCLLHDAWRAGLPDDEVRALVPALEAALAWMRDYGDSDGDGLLEYVDTTGTGLSNQGWKDSGDSVQWRDGSFADGPIALCEVQGYAYEAATHGADLLDAFGGDGTAWRAWAERLRTRFAEAFWIDDPAGAFPAIALDAQKRAVDSLTSNIGHLLGTGLVTEDEATRIAAHLVSPELSSGFGLRTMSTHDRGYWPLSYHGGSVWAHDTAIVVHGLARSGHAAEAATLAEGLLAAAVAFDYRMPELHSGDDVSDVSQPAPYPSACRPQAWSAASAVAVHAALRH